MLRSLLISFAIAYTLIACSKKKEPEFVYIPPAIGYDTSKSYLALGDSYTIGQSVAETERFPVQTVSILAGVGVKFSSPEIIAQTGWTTANLLNRLASAEPKKLSYDIVTLLMGVNNQYQGLSQSQYSTEFTSLLSKAIAYAGNNKKHVVVLSIPDYSVTPYANGSDKARIAREIDEFNIINKNIAQSFGVNYLDITASTRMAATDPTLVAFDGLHPSGKEYIKWADRLAVIIKSVL